MPNSLRVKLSKLKYKGEITQEEYAELIKKLDGHDKELLDKVADRIKSGCACTDYSCGIPFNKDCANCSNYMIDYPSVIEIITEMKAEEVR